MGIEKNSCIRVPAHTAEKVLELLRREGLLESALKPKRDGQYVLFPVKDPGRAVSLLSRFDYSVEACTGQFEKRRKRQGRLEGPVKSYTLIGGVAVFSWNSKFTIEDYKRAALELLEANPRVRSVYLKLDTTGEHRVPRLLHLAGVDSTVAVVREYGLEFEVDVSRVYYNPRLQDERRRVALLAGDDEIVLDMFAGIGVFPIHIASLRRARIVSNDINPEAVRLAYRNVLRNRRRLIGCVSVALGDAILLDRVFKPVFNRIIMNNPTKTPGFLPTALNLLAGGRGFIHYYRLSGSCMEALEEAVQAAGPRARLELVECRRVLEHSPGRHVYVLDLKAEKR